MLHRESIIHSMVEFVDGTVKAQLSLPDMRLPIQFALSYPDRLPVPRPTLDLVKCGSLTFSDLDRQRFRCAYLAMEAGRLGETYPAAMNAADDVAVELFLNGMLRFDQIADVVSEVVDRHIPMRDPGLDEISPPTPGPARPRGASPAWQPATRRMLHDVGNPLV